jgi:hypothetical protein
MDSEAMAEDTSVWVEVEVMDARIVISFAGTSQVTSAISEHPSGKSDGQTDCLQNQNRDRDTTKHQLMQIANYCKLHHGGRLRPLPSARK